MCYSVPHADVTVVLEVRQSIHTHLFFPLQCDSHTVCPPFATTRTWPFMDKWMNLIRHTKYPIYLPVFRDRLVKEILHDLQRGICLIHHNESYISRVNILAVNVWRPLEEELVQFVCPVMEREVYLIIQSNNSLKLMHLLKST